jgi:hypothetical protein
MKTLLNVVRYCKALKVVSLVESIVHRFVMHDYVVGFVVEFPVVWVSFVLIVCQFDREVVVPHQGVAGYVIFKAAY